MDKKQREQAINLFVLKYRQTPKEYGLPVVDVFKSQRAYIYAPTEKISKAYKSSQGLIRWMFTWALWPLAIPFIVLLFYTFPNYVQNGAEFDAITIAAVVFFFFWCTLMMGFVFMVFGKIKSAKIRCFTSIMRIKRMF